MRLGVEITLTEGECRVAKYLGQHRSKTNRDEGVTDQQIADNLDPVQADIDAMGAELAFCRLANIYPDLTLGPRAGGSDAQLAGITIDVKNTHHKNGRLLVIPGSKESAIYVLVTGSLPTYTVVGLYDDKRLRVVERLAKIGKREVVSYAVNQEDLVPMDTDIPW